MMLQGPQINNMPDKRHVIIVIINILDQIIDNPITRPIFQHITRESTINSQPIMSRAANVFAALILASYVEGSLFGPVY